MNYKLTGYKGVILIFILFYFASILISAIFYFLIKDFILQYNLNQGNILNVLTNTIILIFLLFFEKKTKTFNKYNKKINYKFLFLVLLLVLSLKISFDPIFRLDNIINLSLLQNNLNNKTFNYNNIILFINAVILAPILEEIVYRGYILKILKTIKGNNNNLFPITISSLLFTVVHFPYSANTLTVFIVGALSALIVLKLNLKYAIIFHSFYNLTSLVIEDILYKYYLLTIKTLEFNYIYWIIILFALSISVLIIKKIIYLRH